MKKRITGGLLALTLVSCLSLPAQAYSYEELVIKDNLPYTLIYDFSEGFSKVGKATKGDSVTDKWGLIDTKGNEVVSLQYDLIADVSEGLARIGQDIDSNSKTGTMGGADFGTGIDKYGFIDTEGNEVIPLIYDVAMDFSGGFAAVGENYQYNAGFTPVFGEMTMTGTKYGFVDKTGEKVIPFIYDDVAGFQESMPYFASLASSVRKGSKQGFCEGLASVRMGEKWGAIDEQGNTVVSFIYDRMNPFSDGLACVQKDGKYGFIDKQGNVVASIIYDYAEDFLDGMAIVGKEDGNSKILWGAINQQGALVVPMIYDALSDFSEGLAIASKKEDSGYYKNGFIDKSGNLVVPIIYNVASNFSDGLAMVGIMDERFQLNYQCKCGFIDKKGNVVVPLKYDYAEEFSDGLAEVAMNTGDLTIAFPEPPTYGFIDTSGNEVIPLSRKLNVQNLSYGVLKVITQNRSGQTITSIIKNPVYKETSTEPAPTPKNATPTSSAVLVNGVVIPFDAYSINGNNYFKLRDLAKVFSGTEKQFEVTWDGSRSAISLFSGKPYTVVGGEMAKSDGAVKRAQFNASTIYLNGEPTALTAYTINANNYFKLRDIGKLFDFDVSWNGANNTIVIDTSKGYTED